MSQALPTFGNSVGTHFWCKAHDALWWLGKISRLTTAADAYIVRFLDDAGLVKIALAPSRYTAAQAAVRGSWCLQVHRYSSLMRGPQRNVDKSRGTLKSAANATPPPNGTSEVRWLGDGSSLVCSMSSMCCFGSVLFQIVGYAFHRGSSSSTFSYPGCRCRCLCCFGSLFQPPFVVIPRPRSK